MQGLIGGIVAAVVGILVGFWLRGASSKAEKAQLERTNEGLRTELAGERERSRAELHSAGGGGRAQVATISKLEADLDNERKNLAEKLALLESAKQSLAHQFEALAGEILEKKVEEFL